MNTSYPFGQCAGALLLAATLNCAAGDQIQVYNVPKEHPPMQLAQALPPAGTPEIPVNSAPIRWTLPAGWKELPAGGIRLGSFAVEGENGGKADVAITSFPGSVGTELDNVNRWRGELKLAPVGPADLASEPVTVDSIEGKVYDIAGASARTVVAVIPRNGNSWFIKMRGNAATVAAAKPAFLELLKSLRFGGNGGAGGEMAAVGGAPGGADPHAGLQGIPGAQGNVATPDASSAAPKWTVPPQWVEAAPRPMIFKAFSVSGGAGAKAEITVSFFPGAVGGVLANVNRWRRQMGQEPVDQSNLDGVTESLPTAGGQGTLVDFAGADAKTGQTARMVAVILPHGDNTWFYKLTGSAKVVGAQKDAFVQFVKTVQYP